MSDILRYILSSLLGRRYVVLRFYDGEERVKRVVFPAGKAAAYSHDFKIGYVGLLDDGKTDGASYVKAWRPYKPFQRSWPKPPAEAA